MFLKQILLKFKKVLNKKNFSNIIDCLIFNNKTFFNNKITYIGAKIASMNIMIVAIYIIFNCTIFNCIISTSEIYNFLLNNKCYASDLYANESSDSSTSYSEKYGNITNREHNDPSLEKHKISNLDENSSSNGLVNNDQLSNSKSNFYGQLSSEKSPHNMSAVSLFLQADWVIKFVMIFLLLCSIYSWAVIFYKMFAFRKINSEINNFEKIFWSGYTIDVIYRRVKNEKIPSPNSQILIAAMDEYYIKQQSKQRNSQYNHQYEDYNKQQKGDFINKKIQDGVYGNNIKDRICNAMEVAIMRYMQNLQGGFSSLFIISSISPFVGLFGTVWGIMTTFPNIAASKHVTIASVAPGMAEALLATAFGLIAAIPAGIFYNKLNGDLQKIENEVDKFKIEMTNIMLRDI